MYVTKAIYIYIYMHIHICMYAGCIIFEGIGCTPVLTKCFEKREKLRKSAFVFLTIAIYAGELSAQHTLSVLIEAPCSAHPLGTH